MPRFKPLTWRCAGKQHTNMLLLKYFVKLTLEYELSFIFECLFVFFFYLFFNLFVH